MSEMPDGRPTVTVDTATRSVLIAGGTIYPGDNYVPAGAEDYRIRYHNCRILGPRSAWASRSHEDEE